MFKRHFIKLNPQNVRFITLIFIFNKAKVQTNEKENVSNANTAFLVDRVKLAYTGLSRTL